MRKISFNLEKWLQDKSRKIRTGDGRPVRIICTDRKAKSGNIVGLVGEDESLIYVWNNDGKHIVSEIIDNDLFFADEEEELTEFEKKLQIIISEASHWTSDDGSISTYCQFGDKEIKKISGKILDLARKELQPEIDKEVDEALKSRDDVVYLEGFDKGHEDALKDLDSLIEDKVAKKFAELLKDLQTQSPLQPNPYPNPFQPITVLYGCPADFPDITYTKTQQDNE